MSSEFTWDPRKAAANVTKHRVTFHEAAEAFLDDNAVYAPDREHSLDEDRYLVIGQTASGKLLAVTFTIDDDEAIRIITARHAKRSETKRYMNPDDDTKYLFDEPVYDDEIVPDWSRARRGVYSIKPVAGTVVLDPEVYLFFKSSRAVNEALRGLMRDPNFVPPTA